jgi:hypothetical protein
MFGIDQNLLPAIFYVVTFLAVVIFAYRIPRSAARIQKEITKTNELLERMLSHMAAPTTHGEVASGTADNNQKDEDRPSYLNFGNNDDIVCSFLNTNRSK